MQTNATIEELEKALDIINKRYKGNVSFNRLEANGKRVNFTLRVNDSHGPGHRRGFSVNKNGKARCLASACWHVHGHFFDALLKVRPTTWVQARDKRITSTGGNWQNWDAGSWANPKMMSEMCDCHG